jgi:UDP-glucuronate 4-epimerase
MPILVTGAAGFIGAHVCDRLLARGEEVVGLDVVNDYYDPAYKQARLAWLARHPAFRFVRLDCADREAMAALFAAERPTKVVHLAAQAGVRYSTTNPYAYIDANLQGFITILEGCRNTGVAHLVYASSSSVYGLDESMPFSEHQRTDHPMSLYAATKKANELMAHCYSHLYRLPTTGLRFFTVYGPRGRPDMALFLFTKAILAGEPIKLFNSGRMQRSFTFIDDIVEGIVRVLDRPAAPDPAWTGADPDTASSSAPYRIYNIGNHQASQLTDYVAALESAIGRKAAVELLPMQPGDVAATRADIADLNRDVGFTPSTPIAVGIPRFIAWYREYHRV